MIVVLYRPLVLTQLLVGDSPVVVGGGNFGGVVADRLVVVLYRLFVLTQVLIGVSPVIVGIGIFRVEPNGLEILVYRRLVIRCFVESIAPQKVPFGGYGAARNFPSGFQKIP